MIHAILRRMLLILALAGVPWLGAGMASAQDAQQTDAIHNDLRALRDRAVAAIGARNIDGLLAEFTEDVSFTAMNNEVVHGKPAARAYYEKMLGSAGSILEDMRVTIEPDALSTLHNGGESAISTGQSIATFKLRGGLEFTAPLRFTASLVHQDGAWKIAAVHFSANIFDSPIESGIRKYLWPMLAAAAVVGLLLGFLFGRMRRRRA